MILNDKPTTTPGILAELGPRFRDYRMRLDLTRKEVAERSGVGLTTLFRFETGKMYDISLSTLLHLLQAVGLGETWDQLIPNLPESPYLYNDKFEKKQRIRHPKK